MVSHVVPVSKAAMPKQLSEKCLRELWIFPTTILQQFYAVLADVCVLDELFDVTVEKVEIYLRKNFKKALQTSFDSRASLQPLVTTATADREELSDRRRCSVSLGSTCWSFDSAMKYHWRGRESTRTDEAC